MSISRADARVLVVGAGGIGAPATIALSAAGVGTLVLADDDAIERSNLHRQIAFDEADVGRAKTEALRDALRARFPTVRVELAGGRMLPSNAIELARSVDVVLDGCDNFATRFLAADACALSAKPVVHAAAVRWRGTCFVGGVSGRAPCYRCLFEDLPEGPAPDCASAGVLGPICGVIGGVAADAIVRILWGDAGALGRVIAFDGRTSSFRETRVRPRASCPLCGEMRSIAAIDASRYATTTCIA
jgi:adenylyltransferase/sulfurtransferase